MNRPGKTKSIKKTRLVIKIVSYLVISVWALILVTPLVWMVLSSFKNIDEVFSSPLRLFPEVFLFSNYFELFKHVDFFGMMKNTLIITIGSITFQLIGTISTSYGFARFKFKYKNILFGILLGTMMLPWVVTLIPSYVIFARIGWVNTYYPFIIPSLGGNALYIFLMRQFILSQGRELDEAASLDGCGPFKILIYILIPLMKPVIATVIIFSFVNHWSDIVGPSIYLRRRDLFTLSQGMHILSMPFNSRIPWHLCMAYGVLFSLPMIAVFFSAQKVFIAGINIGGTKG